MFLLVISLFAWAASPVLAQEVNLNATVSENHVFIGEQFSLTIEISGESLRNVELPVLPELTGIRILSSTPSRGQSISIVNGRTSTATTYRYTLIAQQEGSYRIPPITVVIDGEEHQTSPIQVEVLRPGTMQQDSTDRMPDIFTEIQLDVENPVVGQQLVASLVIYFREGIEITSYQPSPGWRTDGFWKEQLENIEQPRAETEIVGSVRYRKATLLRYALFPSRSGTLTLSPFELHVSIRSEPRRNDPFGSIFGGFGTNQQRVTVHSEEMDVTVSRINPPQSGVSIGAVGNFQINRSISDTRITVGESVELTTTIEGEGNLPLISKPEYTFPESFELYQPQEETNLNRRGTTISGSNTYREVFIPRTAGTYTIPESLIGIYNPPLHGYDFRVLPAITVTVEQNPDEQFARTSDNFVLQPVSGLALWEEAQTGWLAEKPWVWLGFLLPLLALLIGYRKKRFVERLQSDSDFARAHLAREKADSILEKTKQEIPNAPVKQTYHFLHKAVTGFITDRLSLPAAGLSDREVLQQVESRSCPEDLQRDLKRFLDKCASISYAPVESEEDLFADLNRAETLLNKLDSHL